MPCPCDRAAPGAIPTSPTLLAPCAARCCSSSCSRCWPAAASDSGTDRPGAEATLLLDFQPNAVHAGIYLATERDYDDAEGVELDVKAPGASTDALKQLEAGRADLAILDIHDLGLARQQGADIVGVMAFVQQPLAAVLAQPGIRSPRQLEGQRVGVTGLPSDDAVLRSIVSGAGGDPDAVRPVTIGFQAVKALLAERVAGATAFWSAEGVELKAQRPGIARVPRRRLRRAVVPRARPRASPAARSTSRSR